jgi:sporulation protein YlmC with PRC-barrel domain
MRLELGCTVRCSDGIFGELCDVVVDPRKRRVTHLIVDPPNGHADARLVPVGLARPAETMQPEIALECTVAEVRDMEPVQEFAYLRVAEFPVEEPEWAVGVQDVFALPYYDTLGSGLQPVDVDSQHVGLTYDRVPKGAVELRRASAVISEDGREVGHVDGFIVDGGDYITHLVLQHGHLWGRREVTIPIRAVVRVENDEATLSLTADEVGELDQLPVRRWII